MGSIRINTPKGPVMVNISGDTPTDKEKKLILDNMEMLSKEAKPEPAISPIISPEVADINRYYATRKNLMGQGETSETKEKQETKDLKDSLKIE